MTLNCARPRANILKELSARVAEREALFAGQGLVLYAGCNLPPSDATSLAAPSLDAMPAMGPVGAKEQPASGLIDDLEAALAELACSLFQSTWADARFPSCTLANLAVYHAFLRHRSMLTPAAHDGGHLSQTAEGTPFVVGAIATELPFDGARQTLDTAATLDLIGAVRPSLVVLGRSVMLHPDDIAPVASAARAVGARTVFDASHVAGLIAGRAFPNPLSEGVDFITMSTYKTLGGPPGAIVAGRDPEDGKRLQAVADAAFLANQGAARYPVLLASLLALRDDAGDEAKRTIENAAAFKLALSESEVAVLGPETPAATHQVVVPVGTLAETIEAMTRLEVAGVVVGRCPVPGHPERYGLRFGTQYATRLGLDPGNLSECARAMAPLLRAPPASAGVMDIRAEIADAIGAGLAMARMTGSP